MTYKWIEGDDLKALEPILESRGWTSLNNKTCRALCAYDGEHLAGFLVLQLFPHCEPLWVSKDYRGTGVAEDLADKMMEFMSKIQARGFMVIADNPAAAALCERHGMRKVESAVYIM